MKNKNKDISNIIKGTGFRTPDGYFEQFETNLLKKKIPVSNGFTVPDDYFENFEVHIQKENKLATLKNSGFKTPDHYFDNLENRLYPKTKTSKVISLKRSGYIRIIGLSIAASFLLFFGISNYNSNNNSLNTVADADIEAWLEDGLVSFNTYEIEDIFSDEDLNLVAEETDEISDYLKYTDIELLLYEN